MAEEDRANRRLVAIVAADVVGYSRMMGADEAGTLTALKRHRETLFNPAVAAHKGRVVKLVGDGTLVEFSSVVVLAMGTRGLAKIYDGAPLDAIPDLERAVRLDPLMGHQYWHFLGSAYLVAGQYGKAVEAFRQRIRLAPDTDLSRGLLIAALGHLGEIEEAQRVRAELKTINPRYSFTGHVGRLPFTNPADADRIREGFAKAGLPD